MILQGLEAAQFYMNILDRCRLKKILISGETLVIEYLLTAWKTNQRINRATKSILLCQVAPLETANVILMYSAVWSFEPGEAEDQFGPAAREKPAVKTLYPHQICYKL